MLAAILCLFTSQLACAQTTDLALQAPALSATSLAAGDTVAAAAAMANVGTTTIAQYSAAGFYLSANNTLDASDVRLGADTLFTALAPGRTEVVGADLIIPANTPPGNYYILFAADYGNAFAESNEANNLRALDIKVVEPGVDLFIDYVFVSPSTISAGSKSHFGAFISNHGNKAAPSTMAGVWLSADNNLDDSDSFLGELTTGSALGAGENRNIGSDFFVPEDLAAGSYQVFVKLDYSNAVTESNEANNLGSKPITLTPPVSDLVVDFWPSVTVTPNPVTAGSSITAAANVTNNGAVPADVVINYYLSTDTLNPAADVLIGTYQSAGALNDHTTISTSKTLTIPGTTAVGSYYVIFRLDPNQAVQESNEDNNWTYLPVQVTPASFPELTFKSPPTLQQTTVAAGGTIRNTVTVRNAGTASASDFALGYFLSADDTFDASDRLLGNFNFSGIKPGAELGIIGWPLQVPAGTAPGNYFLLYVIDYHNIQAESTETNNVIGIALSVTSPTQPEPLSAPDLTFTTAPFSYNLKAVGDTLLTHFRIRNAGSSPAGNSHTGFYISQKPDRDSTAIFLGQVAVDALDSGKETGQIDQVLTLPNNLTPGSYFIIMEADHSARITESAETNNTSRIFLHLGGPDPDLRVESIGKVMAGPAGISHSAALRIANVSSTAAAFSQVNLYLSANPYYEPTDLLLASTANEPLPGYQRAVRNTSFTIPTATAPGYYYILAIIDPENQVAERMEENNRAFATFILGETDLGMVPGSAAIRLDVTTHTTLPAGAVTVEAGHQVEASAILRSFNGTQSEFSTSVACYLSTDKVFDKGDVLLRNVSTRVFMPNTNDHFLFPIFTIPPTTPSGAYYILFVADGINGLNWIVESDESNNELALPINVTAAPRPDLVLQVPTVSPDKAAAGETLTLSATLANPGAGPAAASRLRYYLSSNATLDSTDMVLGNTAAAALQASGTLATTAEFILSDTIAAGNYHILLVADADSTVTEENELNNLASIPFQVGAAGKDLIVRSHTATPESIVAGGAAAVAVSLFNQGVETAASGKAGIYLSADQTLDDRDILIGTSAGDSLAALTEATLNFNFTIPLSTPAGNYYLVFNADQEKEVAESNEANNTLAVALTVTAAALPDITITTAAPVVVAPALPGATVATGITLKNQGVAPLSADTISFYLSANNTYEPTDVHVGTGAVPALAAGEETRLSVNLTIPAHTAPGEYHLLALADHSGSVTEKDETNNLYAFAFTVSAPAPDLTLQSPALSAATIARGAALTATATLANAGTGPSVAGKLQYYLSVNDRFESSDVLLGQGEAAALAAGATSTLSASLTIPSATATGDYFVVLVADATGLSAESDEANNLASVALTVSVASGIKDLQAGYSVKLAPNPAPEEVLVSADQVPAGVKVAELTLYDMTGSKVLQMRSPLQDNTLQARVDVRHLRQGTYQLHMRMGQEVMIRKIVITR